VSEGLFSGKDELRKDADFSATSHSIATALPLLALSFFLIVPMFLFVARETTRQEFADFVGQRT